MVTSFEALTTTGTPNEGTAEGDGILLTPATPNVEPKGRVAGAGASPDKGTAKGPAALLLLLIIREVKAEGGMT